MVLNKTYWLVALIGLLNACSFRGANTTDASPDNESDAAVPIDSATTTPDGAISPDAVQPFDPATCPANYMPVTNITGAKYRKISSNANWVDAADDCKNDSNGRTHLIVFESVQEFTDVTNALHPPNYNYTWTGRWQQTGIPGTVTDTVTPVALLTLFRSVSEQPDNLARAEFLHGVPEGAGVKTVWATAPRTFAYSYICECDGLPDVKRP